jgi:hexokinase
MISGRYLGELVRLILVDLAKQGLLFKGQAVSALSKKNSFETALLSRVELDISNDLKDIRSFMAQEFNIQTTLKDRQCIKKVSVWIGTRAARLTAAGVAAMVLKTQSWNGCTIAIDGSVFEHYPFFASRVKIALKETLGVIANNVKLSQARDGSGQGAGIIAALARK